MSSSNNPDTLQLDLLSLLQSSDATDPDSHSDCADEIQDVNPPAQPALQNSLDARDVVSRYLNSLQQQKDINDTRNAIIRYFVPAVGGPVPTARKHKPTTPEEVEAALTFLKTVSLSTLARCPEISQNRLEALDSSPSQKSRVHRNLQDLVDWARDHTYLPPPENPVPEGVCDHIKVGLFAGLNLKPANPRQILERYLAQTKDREVILDTQNAVIRFFVPGCRGPFPVHKPALDYEVELGLKYLETIPLEYLSEAPQIATAALDAFGMTIRHSTRIRNALRDWIAWAISENYLPDPLSVAPWGKACLPQEQINLKLQKLDEEPEMPEQKQTLFEAYQAYCALLDKEGRQTEVQSLKTVIIRYLVPSLGGPRPKHRRATSEDIQTALDYLKTLTPDLLSNARAPLEAEFDRSEMNDQQRKPLRSRIQGWINWFTEQNSHDPPQNQHQPIFNTFYKNGERQKQKKVGMHLYKNRRPVHALCAKTFPTDYINDYLQQQLDSYKKWRESNDVTPGSIRTEENQILQVLGWLHRREKVSLENLRFESLITKNQLVFWVKEYPNYNEYLIQKEIGTQEARRRADEDLERTKRYLEFASDNPKSQARRLFIVLSIAKFIYRDLIGSDDFPTDRDIPIIRRLLDLQASLKKREKVTPQTIKYSETSVPWKTAILAIEKERLRAEQVTIYVRKRSRKGHVIQKRPDTALADDLQTFLSITLSLIVPSRARTFYDLRIEETFKEGILESGRFKSVEDLKDLGEWEKNKENIKFYIHHQAKDFKVGKSMTPTLLESEGWWLEIPDIPLEKSCLYKYIRRWLDWGRTVKNKDIDHNFFFIGCFTGKPMNSSDWNNRIKTIFTRWTRVPVPPKNIRKMFASEFPEFPDSAALLLQHTKEIHLTHYDMRGPVKKMKPVMDANQNLITTTLDDWRQKESQAFLRKIADASSECWGTDEAEE